MKKFIYFIMIALCLLPYQIKAEPLTSTKYSIEYYYDNILDAEETIIKEGKVGNLIVSYPDKKRNGYELFYSTIDDEGLSLVEAIAFNEIKVFYTKIEASHENSLPPKTGIEDKGANIILPSVLILALILSRKKLKN